MTWVGVPVRATPMADFAVLHPPSPELKAMLIKGASRYQSACRRPAMTRIASASSPLTAGGSKRVITLTPRSAGRILLQSGISPSSSGLKRARASTSCIAAGSDSAVTVNWASAFADASYTVSCSVYDATPSNASLKVVHTECIAAGSVSVRVRNDAANALTGTVHCIALHD